MQEQEKNIPVFVWLKYSNSQLNFNLTLGLKKVIIYMQSSKR